MAKATKTLRTERVEVVDSKGRVRIVLGFLGMGESEVFGVVVRDERGRDRAWITAEGPTAQVGLDFDGNMVAALTVGDDGRADLHLAD